MSYVPSRDAEEGISHEAANKCLPFPVNREVSLQPYSPRNFVQPPIDSGTIAHPPYVIARGFDSPHSDVPIITSSASIAIGRFLSARWTLISPLWSVNEQASLQGFSQAERSGRLLYRLTSTLARY